MNGLNLAYLCWGLALLLIIALVRIQRAHKRKRYSLEEVLRPKGPHFRTQKPEFTSGVWYCKMCFRIAGKPGQCDRHSAPVAYTLGKLADLEEYAKMRRLIGTEE